jgi:hypothetical protein
MKKQVFAIFLALHTIASFAQIPSYVPTNGLIGWWPFNGNANDESVNGNNCTIFNSPVLSPDRNGVPNKSYLLDGVDDWIQTNTSILQTNNPHSISMWWKTTDSAKTNQTLFNTNPHPLENCAFHYSSSSSTPPYNITYGLGDGSGWPIMHPDAGQITTTPPTMGLWHHLIWVKDATLTWKFYFDGVLIHTFGPAVNTGTQIANLRFGAENNGVPNGGANFKGNIDDIGLWDRALTQQEITALYNSITTSPCIPSYVPTSGLIGFWPFCGNANDESGNGNNGTPTNGALLTNDRNGLNNNAYSFDGTDDFIIVNGSPSLISDSLTISFWINSTQEFLNNLIEFGDNSSAIWGITASNDWVEMSVGRGCSGGGTSYTQTGILTQGTWYNFTLVLEKNSHKLYKNGVFAAACTKSQMSTLLCSSQNLYFGSAIFTTQTFYDGKLDDIGVWNRALTQIEITSLYSGGNVGVNDNNMETDFLIFPNPATNLITIETTLDYSALSVSNVLGQQVLNKQNSKTINIEKLDKGVYFIQLFDVNGKLLKQEKFIKLN